MRLESLNMWEPAHIPAVQRFFFGQGYVPSDPSDVKAALRFETPFFREVVDALWAARRSFEIHDMLIYSGITGTQDRRGWVRS